MRLDYYSVRKKDLAIYSMNLLLFKLLQTGFNCLSGEEPPGGHTLQMKRGIAVKKM